MKRERDVPPVPSFLGNVPSVPRFLSVFESLRHRVVRVRDHDQMHMIGHEAVAQQRETVEFGILAQQFEIRDAVSVVGQNHLPRIATLRNMMGTVDDNDARQSSHPKKISGRIPL